MIKCPRGCDPAYVVSTPENDTTTSQAYACMACGKTWHYFIRIRLRSAERRENVEKYGTKEDI